MREQGVAQEYGLIAGHEADEATNTNYSASSHCGMPCFLVSIFSHIGHHPDAHASLASHQLHFRMHTNTKPFTLHLYMQHIFIYGCFFLQIADFQ
jgi:hypothetical protein